MSDEALGKMDFFVQGWRAGCPSGEARGVRRPASGPGRARGTGLVPGGDSALSGDARGYPFNERVAPARLGDFTVLPPTFGADYPLFVSKFDAHAPAPSAWST